MNKPTLPQGTRDFSPEVVRKRQYIINTIRSVFELHGFQPLETPAFENLDTLMGKYGEEGDKLMFKILNNGLDNPAKATQAREAFEKVLEGKTSKLITERALRYDLTIPFARYVAMNHGQLSFPFKRYQVQPVWRADRPQKGRYREFWQCDADVVGSRALINEVEFANIYHAVFQKLGIGSAELRINNRKVLAALAEQCGGAENLVPITVAIDKLDKIGAEKVKEELAQRGLSQEQINTVEKYLNISGSNDEKLEQAKNLFAGSSIAEEGLQELQYVAERTRRNGEDRVVIDFTLARGLNYYTGIIFEAKAPATVKIGSIGGGGRYDDLTGLFGVSGVAGCGISFGLDRIYDVLEELQLFPEAVEQGTRVLFFNLGEAESDEAAKLLQMVRDNGVASEIYHEAVKLDKQFKYAERRQIPFVVIIGSKELEEQVATVKNIRKGEQQSVTFAELPTFFT
ncbi:MAG: histidine--tRNA ligase [Flavisolibacter sp.]